MEKKMAEWTFVTNYAVVLSCVASYPRITAREMANQIGITERAVRKILKDLETEGFLAKKREGRRLRYSVKPKLMLRHPTQRNKAVGELLKVLGWNDGSKKKRLKKRR
jgi:predicted ArsR family transcriptional regulator